MSPYTKQTWVDNNPSYPGSAVRFNYIEDGIYNAMAVAEAAQTQATPPPEVPVNISAPYIT